MSPLVRPYKLKFIPRGLPRVKAMGDSQGGEAQLSPLTEPRGLYYVASLNLIFLEACFEDEVMGIARVGQLSTEDEPEV